MKKLSTHVLSLWLILQVLVSSMGFTLVERSCKMPVQSQEEMSCCTLPSPEKKEPSCCSDTSESKSSDSDDACCTFDAQYHFFAFKSYFISSSEESTDALILPLFHPNLKISYLECSEVLDITPPYSIPPPLSSRQILALHAVLLI